MYLTRITPSMTRRNTLWKYTELTLSSYPLPPPSVQFLPNAEMVLGVCYLVVLEAMVVPIKL